MAKTDTLILIVTKSVLYQISLSTYYLMVIYFGMHESKIRKYTCVLHIPLLVGLALAFSGIPLYGNS